MYELREESTKYEDSMAISGALWAIRVGISGSPGASELLISSLLASTSENYKRVGHVRTGLANIAKTVGDNAVIETAFANRMMGGSNMPTWPGTSCQAGAVKVA